MGSAFEQEIRLTFVTGNVDLGAHTTSRVGMFATENDASKVALAALVERLVAEGFDLIDCQQESEYLRRFGARPIPAARFLKQLSISLAKPERVGRWAS